MYCSAETQPSAGQCKVATFTLLEQLISAQEANSGGASGEFKWVQCNYLHWDMIRLPALNCSPVKGTVGFLIATSWIKFYFPS